MAISSGDTLRRRWVFLFRWHDKRIEMGLGAATTVPLAKARERRKGSRRPAATRLRRAEASRTAMTKRPFREMLDEYHDAKSKVWRSAKVIPQWKSPLETYAARLPPIAVDAITMQDVVEVLKPNQAGNRP